MHRVGEGEDLSVFLRETADRLDEENHGGLTGVVLVVTGVPGVFEEDKPATGTWVSMQGGMKLYGGLLSAAADVMMLREAKGRKVQ